MRLSIWNKTEDVTSKYCKIYGINCFYLELVKLFEPYFEELMKEIDTEFISNDYNHGLALATLLNYDPTDSYQEINKQYEQNQKFYQTYPKDIDREKIIHVVNKLELNDLNEYFDRLKDEVNQYVNKNKVMEREYNQHKMMMMILNSLKDGCSIKIQK